jgi:hypothetical protein
VLSENGYRRHLNKKELAKAIVKAFKVARESGERISAKVEQKLPQSEQTEQKLPIKSSRGRPKDNDKAELVDAAAAVGVSESTLETALAEEPDRPKILKPPKPQPRKPKKELPYEDQVWRKWTHLINGYAPKERRAAMDSLVAQISTEKSGIPEEEQSKRVRFELVCKWLSNDGVKPKYVIDENENKVLIKRLIFGANGD